MALHRRKIGLGILVFLFFVFLVPTSVSAAESKYNHISVKVANNFSINIFENAKIKSTKVDARLSEVTIKLDKKNVLLDDSNLGNDKNFVEYKSKDGNDKSSVFNISENSILEVVGKLSYTYNNERFLTDFYISKKTSQSNNECKVNKDSNKYGYECVFSSNEIQKMMNNSVVNIENKCEKVANDTRTVIIYQNDEKYKTIDLTKDNKFTYSLVGLPIGEFVGDSRWVDYKYTIEEIPSDSNISSDIKYNKENNIFEINEKQSQKDKKNEDKKDDNENVETNGHNKDYFNDDYKYEEDDDSDSAWLGLKNDDDNYTTASVKKADDSPNTADDSMLYLIIIMIVSSFLANLYIWYFYKDMIKGMFKDNNK